MADNPKPFHEAIVDVINMISERDQDPGERLLAIASLARISIIPANHDKIEKVFRHKFRYLGIGIPQDLSAHIEAEKARAEKKAAEKTAKETATKYEKGDILV
ncbi:MAG: hypothetical protein A3B13_00390 [Candidatus Liptonbacteria bacterium RIFCSPLOWO2_01_FULL_45_15]|uniref:Uncharacterized protein n=1 Tax=Candidatus Liptonbacteria bacterium RIFCSPLOWO2_01_FULL_45_15 TaxID=1798649 RepID=A0A1G2CK42_9BACT|nr:MAG: hypothetical protein A3B13_00390 [Candidatus Liptonbacteria bacterium RIFCSPLOWO2_01_FULL_45_15]